MHVKEEKKNKWKDDKKKKMEKKSRHLGQQWNKIESELKKERK